MYPIRLIAEAKWYKTGVRLSNLRDFVGVVKDISENYFVEQGLPEQQFKDLLERRYTDCGAIFSATSFSLPAQHYAYAHCIFMIPFQGIKILEEVRHAIERIIQREERRFKIGMYETLEEGESKSLYRKIAEDIFNRNEELTGSLDRIGSYLGLLDGIYPIHMISTEKLDFSDPMKPDLYEISSIEKEYMRNLGFSVLFSFRDRKGTTIQFTMPTYIIQSMFRVTRSLQRNLFEYIDTPVQIRRGEETYRRIFQVKISNEDRDRIFSNLRSFRILQ